VVDLPHDVACFTVFTELWVRKGGLQIVVIKAFTKKRYEIKKHKTWGQFLLV